MTPNEFFIMPQKDLVVHVHLEHTRLYFRAIPQALTKTSREKGNVFKPLYNLGFMRLILNI